MLATLGALVAAPLALRIVLTAAASTGAGAAYTAATGHTGAAVGGVAGHHSATATAAAATAATGTGAAAAATATAAAAVALCWTQLLVLAGRLAGLGASVEHVEAHLQRRGALLLRLRRRR